MLKVSGYFSVIMTHTHDDNHQNGFTQPAPADDKASLTDENSAGRQNVTALMMGYPNEGAPNIFGR